MNQTNAVVPNKPILEALAATLEILVKSRKEKQLEAQSAQAVLNEPGPAPFDHEALGRAVAQAQVADLLNGTSTAASIAADGERERAAADRAADRHKTRQASASKQLGDSSRVVAALTSQAEEMDLALRREFAASSVGWAADAETNLAEAASRFVERYIDYKAMMWLRGIEGHGDGRKQFYLPEQYEFTLSAPDPILEALPSGHHKGLGEAIVYKGYTMTSHINERFRQIMGDRTNGLYPAIGAGLNMDPGRTGAT